MRKLVLWLVFSLACGLALPVAADDDDLGTKAQSSAAARRSPVDRDSWGSGLRGDEFAQDIANRTLMGLNSMLTFPADPVMSAISPDKEFDDLPLAIVTKWPVGFVQGTLLGVYRAATGAFDFALGVVTPMKMLSPEPRYLIFPNIEHDEY